MNIGVDPESKNLKKILLAGSSHTRLFFFSVKKCLEGRALVSKLPYNAGNTVEMLDSLSDWPLEDKDIVHVYAGHRDLILNETGQPFVNPEQFRENMGQILEILFKRTAAKIVFSNIPPVAEIILEADPQRNQRILQYNNIIKEVIKGRQIPMHDFSGFVLSRLDNQEKYSDGLHFTRRFYQEFGMNLADFLIQLL
jgi:lysophospholipase L1-like esterase